MGPLLKSNHYTALIILFCLFFGPNGYSQNPIISNQFTADPSARVFDNKVFLFPSHDIKAKPGQGRPNWFCMEDYHVFSSDNLTQWTDHGSILSQYTVPWVDSTQFNFWAPDCIEHNGKYYFYFPAGTADTANGGGFRIGVAIAEQPQGPYTPLPQPIKGVRGIDPNILIDQTGAYLYWANKHIFVAKLDSTLTQLASKPDTLKNLPSKGLVEGPWVFERNGIYYLTYPHVENQIERLEYAIGPTPMGPFTFKGVIMDESATRCWTNHQSIVEYNQQWYLFYHHNDLSPNFDKNRSVRIDSLFFNPDGTIIKVKPTLRGVGVTQANQRIDIDRYSHKSVDTEVVFNDSLNPFLGSKTILSSTGSWIQYNNVNFGNNPYSTLLINTLAFNGGQLQLRLNGLTGPVMAEISVPKSREFVTVSTPLVSQINNINNLVLISKDTNRVEFDWIEFADKNK